MLGVALTAQRAGWGGEIPPPPQVISITSQSAIQYELYQEPSFSWMYDDSGAGPQIFPTFAVGNIDLSGYADLPGFNNRRSCQIITFNLYMPPGLSTNDGIKFDTRFRGGDGDFTTNWAWVSGYSEIVRLQINCAAAGGIEMPDTGYDAYNGRWLTIVAAVSETAESFTNFTGTGFMPVSFRRTAVFDTETGELLAKDDFAGSDHPGGVPSNLAQYMSDAGNILSTDRNNVEPSWNLGGQPPEAGVEIKFSNYWVSWGTTFDPLSVSDRSWLTTRPNAQIGDAVAWVNGTFADYGNTANFQTAWATHGERDLFTPDDADRGMDLIQYDGNSAIFNAQYSTDVPRSKG